MFKRIIFCLLAYCLIFGTEVLANPKIDSLLKSLSRSDLNSADSIRLLSELGYEYWTVEPRKSIVYGQSSLELALRHNVEERIAFSYRVIGVAYWALGDYPVALQNLLQSLDQYEKIENEEGLGNVKMNIGLVLSDQSAWEEAKKYFREGKRIFEKLQETGRVATTDSKIATVLIAQDSLDLAREFLHSAIEIHYRNNFNYGLAEAYNRLGIVYRKLNDIEASLNYLYRSRDLSISINDMEGLAKCYSDIGFTELLKGDFKGAETHFRNSEKIAREIGSKKWQLEAYRGLAESNEQKGEAAEALRFFKMYQVLRDSILNEQKIIAVAGLQQEYKRRQQVQDLANSRQKISLLQMESQNKNRLFFFIGFAALLAFISVLLGIRYYRLKSSHQRTEIENINLKQVKLQRDLELSQRELTAYALNFLQKNEVLAELKNDLDDLKSSKEIIQIKRKLHQAKTLDKDWEKFKMQFDKVHGGFLKELKEKHPNLSQTELKHCSLIRINLNIKECASILSISPESIKTSRYRLRKKMGVESDLPLYDYLSEFGK